MVDAISATTPSPATAAPAGSAAPARDAGDRRPGAARGDRVELSPDQQRVVRELQARDREVRAHEAAHQAAAAGLAGGANFSYRTGPDGRQYVSGGEVQIDMSRERDPAATIAKMQRVVAAALAPADPSGQDRAVAAEAREIALAASQQQAQQETEQRGGTGAADERGGKPGHAARAYGEPPPAAGGQLSLIA